MEQVQFVEQTEMTANKINRYEECWQRFVATGAVSDYLSYSACLEKSSKEKADETNFACYN